MDTESETSEFVAVLQGRLDYIRELCDVLLAKDVDARLIPPGASNPNT